MSLDLTTDVVALTRALCDIESVSHDERAIADQVEAALRTQAHLSVERHGHTIVARTNLGRGERVILAGHLDTVPVNHNFPSRQDAEFVHGLGSCDMKGGDAVLLLAATIAEPTKDLTFVFYEAEEVASIHNGLRKIAESHPELLEADFAILGEPSNAGVEAGCQGTMRVVVTVTGERAHSARAWMGRNAIHEAGVLLARLSAYEPRQPIVDGLRYHEGLNAVFVEGGVAGNVIPDRCTITVNYRFAPDRSEAEAEAFLRDFFVGHDLEVTDSAPGARPGLDLPAVKAFVEATGGAVEPKYGWTDVARFSVLGIPAVNFGPGDPSLAHKQDERVPIAQLEHVWATLRTWLTTP
ncbi:succinyl-diaminopimelate desuccinylase [Nocardioides baekrokdamisoli]|uniref:Succinyl-diaminopimelate desuccinylase n=1 Tax=Nocardioides baekrokdamisoli TaxID=1804624 RepID=A0A3G9ISX4_9ACTN|nr:succinyl-diaminopimelate desuccinylase [Nocardioides baekrokdamisoli]BBH16721.1 succinyl-diaminopimelate desuccinylase [Nocardioides baekrokdamisoli]